MNIEVANMYRTDDKSIIVVNQIGINKFRIIVKSYNKFQYACNVSKEELKSKIIDFMINHYTIRLNTIFPNLYDEIFNSLEANEFGEKKYIFNEDELKEEEKKIKI